jgi:hypothetical protein
VKAAFFERFWESSGKVAVRTLAAAAAVVGFVPATLFLFFSFVLLLIVFVSLVPEVTLDRPSGIVGTPEDSRTPSGRDVNVSPRAQV